MRPCIVSFAADVAIHVAIARRQETLGSAGR